jgi:hypothetical protein
MPSWYALREWCTELSEVSIHWALSLATRIGEATPNEWLTQSECCRDWFKSHL